MINIQSYKVNKYVVSLNKNVYNVFGGNNMRIYEQLKILSIKTNMTFAEIGEKIDKSPQAFSQK